LREIRVEGIRVARIRVERQIFSIAANALRAPLPEDVPRALPIRSGPGRSDPGRSGALRGPSGALVNTHLGQRGFVDLQTVKRGHLGVDQPEKNCQLAAMVGEVAEDRVRNHDVARLLLHSLAP